MKRFYNLLASAIVSAFLVCAPALNAADKAQKGNAVVFVVAEDMFDNIPKEIVEQGEVITLSQVDCMRPNVFYLGYGNETYTRLRKRCANKVGGIYLHPYEPIGDPKYVSGVFRAASIVMQTAFALKVMKENANLMGWPIYVLATTPLEKALVDTYLSNNDIENVKVVAAYEAAQVAPAIRSSISHGAKAVVLGNNQEVLTPWVMYLMFKATFPNRMILIGGGNKTFLEKGVAMGLFSNERKMLESAKQMAQKGDFEKYNLYDDKISSYIYIDINPKIVEFYGLSINDH